MKPQNSPIFLQLIDKVKQYREAIEKLPIGEKGEDLFSQVETYMNSFYFNHKEFFGRDILYVKANQPKTLSDLIFHEVSQYYVNSSLFYLTLIVSQDSLFEKYQSLEGKSPEEKMETWKGDMEGLLGKGEKLDQLNAQVFRESELEKLPGSACSDSHIGQVHIFSLDENPTDSKDE